MRFAALTIAVLVITGCKKSKEQSTSAETAVVGHSLTATDMKFEAWFPKAPKEDKAKDGKRFTSVDPNTKGVYMIQASPFARPVPLTDTATIDRFFVGAKIGLTQGPNKDGKKIVEEKYQFAGEYPAWKVDVALPDERIYRVRMIHRGTHFYQVIVAGRKEFVDSADAAKFLDSLKFID
jgi:hypothetical protein